MMKKLSNAIIIVHFGELWLRGKNRNSYIQALKRNITDKLAGEGFTLKDDYDRLIITPGRRSSIDVIASKVSKVFGVSAYEVAYISKPTLRSIVSTSISLIRKEGLKKVKIIPHRSHKEFKFDSMDIIRDLAKAAQRIGAEPVVKGFESQIYISVKKDAAYIYSEKRRGAGGLPVGTSGSCVVLLSGGIDSPVAAWYAMKRGLIPIYVHVHGFSSNDEASSSKISRIVRLLSEYYPSGRTYYIPSHIFQIGAIKTGKYELVMMKGFMLRVAEEIAKKEGAGAIITGESLGQVASQTLSNIAAEESMSGLPILRPLIGMDKLEITDYARRIGTYEESIKPYKDVCSINARNPAISMSPKLFKSISKDINLIGLARRSIKIGAALQ